MKLSEKWLQEWVNPHLEPQQLAEQLTLAGLEVKAQPIAKNFKGVRVGEIIAVKSHEVANILVCQVNIGEILTIVTGASNVKAGMKVPVATIGAQLPTATAPEPLKSVTIKGIISDGMLCARQELGL